MGDVVGAIVPSQYPLRVQPISTFWDSGENLGPALQYAPVSCRFAKAKAAEKRS